MKAGALRTGLLGGVLIMLVAGIYATKHAREAEWKEKYARSVKRTAALMALDPLNPQAEPLPDAPPSPWFERERTQFSSLLQGQKASIFIAPVQVRDFPLDRSTRSLMARQLSAALAREYGQKVLDIDEVQRALGDSAYRIERKQLDRLSSDSGALQRVIIEAGHDFKSNLLVSLAIERRSSPAGDWRRKDAPIEWKLGIGPQETAADVFSVRLIPPIAARLGLAAPAVAQHAPAPVFHLPRDIATALGTTGAHPLHKAMLHQLLATLAPAEPERARERLFEQALVALQGAGAGQLHHKLLRARAAFNLHSRPAALAILGPPQDAAEQAFAAYLNGNLPDMEAAMPVVDNELVRLMLEVDLHDLRHAYELPVSAKMPAYIETVLAGRSDWQLLFARRITDGELSGVLDNVYFKHLLEKTSPLGQPLADSVQDLADRVFHTEPIAHGMRALAHIASARSSCAAQPCLAASYLDLMEAAVVSNGAREITRANLFQGAPERARRLGETLEPYLDGHPAYALAMIGVLRMNEKEIPTERQAAHRIRKNRYAHQGAHWEMGQSRIARLALAAVEADHTAVDAYPRLYGSEIPLRPDWPELRFQVGAKNEDERIKLDMVSNARQFATLPYIHADITVPLGLARSAERGAEQKAALRAEFGNRFAGHPKQQELAALLAGGAPYAAPTLASLRAALAARPDRWDNVDALARYLIETGGAYRAAQQLYLAFPGFRDGNGYQPVALSNYAADAAFRLLRHGAIDEARPLLKISADFETGSERSMHSAHTLALLDDDYQADAKGALARLTRYDSSSAFADYMTWQFVFGQGAAAWTQFDQLQQGRPRSHIWDAALVGHRMERHGWAQQREWLLRPHIRRTAIYGQKPAMLLAVALNAQDRMPTDDLAATLAQIAGPQLAANLGAEWMGEESALNPGARTRRTPDLIEFAGALVDLRKGNPKAAVAKFHAMEANYAMTGKGNRYHYALPYFAWASARTGDPYKLGKC